MGNYKKIDKDDILYIKNTIQDDERVLVGENINEEYSHDELHQQLSGCGGKGKISRRDRGDHEICIRKYDSGDTEGRRNGSGWFFSSDGAWHHDRYHPDEPDS